MELDAGIEPQEPGFSQFWDLGRIPDIEEDRERPLPTIFIEVSRLGLLLGQNRLDLLGETAVLYPRIACLN